jgi:hypothetical protein
MGTLNHPSRIITGWIITTLTLWKASLLAGENSTRNATRNSKTKGGIFGSKRTGLTYRGSRQNGQTATETAYHTPMRLSIFPPRLLLKRSPAKTT